LFHPVPLLIENLNRLSQSAPLSAGDWNIPPEKAAIVPIKQRGQLQPAGFFVVGLNPHRRYHPEYSGFVDLLSGQIAAGLANARAYEAEPQARGSPGGNRPG
jgi:GAF domain-containing protein